MKIAVACGGTGGHIFPGLAVAEVMQARGHGVTLWLAGRDVEQASTVDWEGPIVRIRAKGFSSRVGLGAIGVCFRLLAAITASVREMRTSRPDVVLAMGSYASVGPVVAARLLRIPTVLHESNAVPGRAVAFLARFASRIAVGCQAAAASLVHDDVTVTGFPLRRRLDGSFEDGALAPDRFTVLVMGGSQGAHALNETVSAAVIRLQKQSCPVNVVHLAGRLDAESIREQYRDAGVCALVFDFLGEMGKAYHAADLAIARSGAATCAELAACAVPALLVPLPTARRQHQLLNALVVSGAGGADVIAQEALTVKRVCEAIDSLRCDPDRLAEMRKMLKQSAVLDGADQLANLVEATPRFPSRHG